MHDIIDWLTGFEETAARLYEKAADRFKDDSDLSEFLSGLSNDEKTHRDYLIKAAEIFRKRRPARTVIVDRSAREKVEREFKRQERLIDEGKLTRAGLFDFIVANEYSEWNDLFLFVVNTVKKERGELIPALVTTQQHKRSIERFIGSQPDLDGPLESLKRLKPVWVEKLLVVDDEDMIAEAVAATLEDEGVVDKAANGKEALEMIGEKFYAVVVTDIEMPVMNGIEFYKEAVRLFPSIKGRFLFFCNGADLEYGRFFRENGLVFLDKPTTLREIRDAVAGILSR